MPDTVPSGVGQQQLIPHENTEALNVGSDLENTSPASIVPGAFGEMNDNEWTGRLYSTWNGTYAYALALAAEAIGDLYAHAMRLMSISRRIHINAQEAISVAKVIICDLNLSLILKYPYSISRHGSIRPRPRWCGLEIQLGWTSATLVETIRNARGVSFCSAESSR